MNPASHYKEAMLATHLRLVSQLQSKKHSYLMGSNLCRQGLPTISPETVLVSCNWMEKTGTGVGLNQTEQIANAPLLCFHLVKCQSLLIIYFKYD